MKKSAAVLAAEQLATDKAAELEAAQDAVRRLAQELAEAHSDVREKQEADDAPLPQCRMVSVYSHSSNERNSCRVVIVRKTPTGMLVVRRVGDAGGTEYKFKMSKFGGDYKQAEKVYGYGDRRELRDVPAEYMPPAEPDDDDDE